jgi:hypothetical protein
MSRSFGSVGFDEIRSAGAVDLDVDRDAVLGHPDLEKAGLRRADARDACRVPDVSVRAI